MAGKEPVAPEAPPVVPAAPTQAAGAMSWPRRIARWTGLAILGLAAAVVLFLIGLNSDAGRRFVITQIEKYEFENGMKIGIGRLDGSLYGAMVVRDFSLSDTKGVFLASPEVRIDWRPFAYLSNHVDVRTATAQTMTLQRLPEFKVVPDTGEPLLPDLDIDVGTVRVDRFIFAPAVAGERQDVRIAGKVAIADRRAQISADAETIGANGKGDALKLLVDAVPETNRLAMTLDIRAPQGGVIAAIGGLDAPMTARLDGKGDWKAWDGQLVADLGTAPLARIALSARDGLFAAKGKAQAARLFTGRTAALLGGETSVDLTARLAERKADLDGRLSSEAFRLGISGGVDLGSNRYDGLQLAFVLLRPAALAPALRGNGVRATARLDGAFALPTIAYQANANALAVNDIVVETLNLSGKARIDADQIVIPVAGRAARIRGLDTAAGGTLVSVRLDGDIAYKDGRLLSDNLRLRSPRIDAKAIVVADLNRGFYTGAIDGRVNDYRIESVGIFDIGTDVDLKTAPRGGFELAGRVRARSTRLFNSGVRDLLGGNAVATSDLRYGTDGIVRFSNLRLSAPRLRVTGGQGSYAPDGRVQLTARAQSTDYGPLGVQLAGTISDPRATLTAERPGLGIGLANLVARVNGAPGGYRLAATGETDYGPLSADVVLLTAKGPLTIDVERADLSGIGLSGRLVQSAAGPFEGQLDAAGQGLGGLVRLSAAGEHQAAAIHMRANNVALPGAAQLTVGSAIVDADVTLYDTPHVVADIQVAQTHIRDYDIAVGRVKIDYRNGAGKAQAMVEGTSGVPFRIAANADLTPQLWRASVRGRATGIAFRTDSPARIIPGPDGYELLPTTINLGRGSHARVAGRFGEGIMLQSRLDRVNMAILNAVYPDMGLGGRATGSLDFEQAGADAFPRADARLTITNFTRTTAASVSQPVDVNFAGKLLADGGEARAVMRKRGTVIGRLQASLRPLGPGAGDWMTRLRAAPLGGGFRYNGPADTLYSFAGPAQQDVSGPIAVAADFSCSLFDPCLDGVVRGKGMTYENQIYGTRLTDMSVNGRFTGNRLVIEDMQATAGDGSVKAKGYISLAAADGYPMNLVATLDNARLARSENMGGRATGELTLEKVAGQTALLSGTLRLPEARYRIVREGAASVPALTGVRRKLPSGRLRVSGDGLAAVGGSLFDLIRLDIRLRAPDQIYVSGMGLESEWQADVTLRGTTEAPRMTGEVELVRGTLDFAGRSFELEEGRITFPTGDAYDPAIRLLASDTIETVTVNVNVSGRAQNPQISFSSVPGLPQDEIVSRILFGDSITELSPIQAVQLAASLNALRGSGGLSPLGVLRSAAGIDRLRVLGADDTEGRGTAIAAGHYISKDIYLEVITDGKGYTATQLEISLTRALSILSQAGGSGQTNMSIRYRKDY
ncbi:MAG: translocation/assembly module TamB domain-containing protein [Sphingopyxis sp.]|uniref:translocation/assembly module TamB domain-containing protein n=1 Tax=Sphingopyxis sp. TaxID=1908224 RepID=UPI002ABB3CBE|nr:translocation/assembly module TamB domain-containing protein [Sphingopyxis sp.]MDZ3831650.1 translocation/assembly module TamB domain-containing protein [Sphingopyxis sp.]